jgi:hypothetical protein
VLLVSAMRNPTVRLRYLKAREVKNAYRKQAGQPEGRPWLAANVLSESRACAATGPWPEVQAVKKPNGDVGARPWCQGFHAAMQPRLQAWAPLLDLSNINHGLLLPILLHCIDDHGRPLLGPARTGRETEEFLRNAYTDIPAVVEAMRQHWMPTRYAQAG